VVQFVEAVDDIGCVCDREFCLLFLFIGGNLKFTEVGLNCKHKSIGKVT
jgi:hypothetical protein